MDGTQAVGALGALAHEHRLAVYRMLVERGPDGLAAGAIAGRLGIPASSLTFHLQHLLRAGLATQRRIGRQLIYAADFGAMNALIGFLTENCCGRDGPQLAAACAPACSPPATSASHRRSA
ncbi:MAG TPA: helix-turn-helix domain-containing protein [Crenalkalicoccus sp.]|jgi:DNA-binding transcriptional ArsR family regulator|nr:helix-turn-helix domain-containing protein [Crenalkalicoccus sp.]